VAAAVVLTELYADSPPPPPAFAMAPLHRKIEWIRKTGRGKKK
jgi:hypothetical protein